jgi:hypothetical protein
MKQSLYDYIAGNFDGVDYEARVLRRIALEALFKLYEVTGSKQAERELARDLIDLGIDLEGFEL